MFGFLCSKYINCDKTIINKTDLINNFIYLKSLKKNEKITCYFMLHAIVCRSSDSTERSVSEKDVYP